MNQPQTIDFSFQTASVQQYIVTTIDAMIFLTIYLD